MTTAGSLPVRPSRWGLKGKLIVSMLLVGVVPLLTGLLLAFFQGSREIREVSGESFKALAIEAARKLDLLVGEEVARTSRIAADPVIVLEMERQRDARHEDHHRRDGCDHAGTALAGRQPDPAGGGGEVGGAQ